MNGTDASALVTLDRVTKTYSADPRGGRVVLDGIDFRLEEREIVALLGQSGCGKSTLLRIIAGLQPATGGAVLYRGRPVAGPTRGIAMVFQSFALFPWLTVLENVELGLEAQGIGRGERRERALQAIDMIGLDGFESAYPKELSGGMRQRVGFARALVVSPDVLLLDEPFSALDVLTAETLRGDLLELWHERRISTAGIVFVSHNIGEAVAVADRILVMASHPGRIRAAIPVPIEHPRDSESPQFRELVDEIYRLLTEGLGRPAAAPAGGRREQAQIGVGHRLPAVSIQQLIGLLDALVSAPYNGRADLPALAESENIEMDRLLRLVEALHLLGFGQIEKGDVMLSRAGRAFVEADILGRKKIFAEHLLHHVPLAGHIRRILDERPSHRAPEGRFLNELQDYLPEDEADQVLQTMINWGRYAELFAYDYDAGVLSLDNP